MSGEADPHIAVDADRVGLVRDLSQRELTDLLRDLIDTFAREITNGPEIGGLLEPDDLPDVTVLAAKLATIALHRVALALGIEVR